MQKFIHKGLHNSLFPIQIPYIVNIIPMVFDNMGENPHICNINQNNYIMRTKTINLV